MLENSISKEDQKKLFDLLSQHSTMSLSTVSDKGLPWSSILFYSPDQDLSLVYISKATSEHSQHIKKIPQVNVSIYKDDQDRKKCLGFQIRAKAELIESKDDLKRAKEIYLHRYSFIQKSEELVLALKKMSFYRIRPDFIRLIDNSKGFAFKEEWGNLNP